MEPSAGLNTSDTSFPTPNMSPSFVTPPLPQQSEPNFQTLSPSSIPTASDGGKSSDGSTVTTSGGSGGGRRRRVIMLVLGLFLMVGGIATGTYFLTRQQLQPSFAWDCTTYSFEVDKTGTVIVKNESTRDLPAQVAKVYINDQLSTEFEVPALDSGSGATLGIVPVPEDGRFSWRVEGNKDCEDTGEFKADLTAQCLNVKAFDETWEPLSQVDLSALDAKDVVRFTIAGLTSKGSFDSARFTINGELMDEVSTKRPGTDEFYYEYEVPANVTDFVVTAELNHSELGWIGK